MLDSRSVPTTSPFTEAVSPAIIPQIYDYEWSIDGTTDDRNGYRWAVAGDTVEVRLNSPLYDPLAVPIVLATYPAAAGLEIGNEVFNLVFFAVILSIIFQGSTLGLAAKWLGLSSPARPKALFNLEMITMAKSDYDMVIVDLPGPRGAAGPRLRDLRLPEGAIITLITRGQEVVLPKGETQLLGWDQVTVLAHAPDEDKIREQLSEAFPRDNSSATSSPALNAS